MLKGQRDVTTRVLGVAPRRSPQHALFILAISRSSCHLHTMTSPSPYLQTLQALKGKRDRLVKKLHSDNATDDDDKRLHKVLTDVCENVRAASKDPSAADGMPALLDQTSKMLDATIMMAYDSDAFDFLPSYAHTEDGTAPLIKDPTQQANLVGQLGRYSAADSALLVPKADRS